MDSGCGLAEINKKPRATCVSESIMLEKVLTINFVWPLNSDHIVLALVEKLVSSEVKNEHLGTEIVATVERLFLLCPLLGGSYWTLLL